MFPGCLQDFSRMFSGCSDGSSWPGGIWWSFQMKVWTLMIQRKSKIQLFNDPSYSMIPAIRWFPAIQWFPAIRWCPAIRWSPAIGWSIRSMDFDNWKVYSDTSITDGLVILGYHHQEEDQANVWDYQVWDDKQRTHHSILSSQSTPSMQTELIHVHKLKFGPTNQQTKNTIRDGGRTPLYTSYTVYTFCTVYTVPTDAVKQY